jgi:hypothetical protein
MLSDGMGGGIVRRIQLSCDHVACSWLGQFSLCSSQYLDTRGH